LGGIAIASLSTTFRQAISLGPAVCWPNDVLPTPIPNPLLYMYIFLTRPKAIKFVHKSVTLSQRIAGELLGGNCADSHELIDTITHSDGVARRV